MNLSEEMLKLLGDAPAPGTRVRFVKPPWIESDLHHHAGRTGKVQHVRLYPTAVVAAVEVAPMGMESRVTMMNADLAELEEVA